MRVGIVTNLNGRGLEKDARLLTPIIESLGHEVELLQFDAPCEKTFNLLIFLEITPRNLIGLSESPPWLIVNPEFLKAENIKLVERSFGKVLCKTHEAHRICSALFGDKAHYTGFISEDKFDAMTTKQLKFLHVAGQSRAKGTQAVIDAWRWTHLGKSLRADLTVVADWTDGELPDGVSVVSKISDEELRHLQNECQFHLQPSQTEGWSHVIHEALSVNATILTVDAEPMNEVKAAYKIPPVSSSTLNSAKLYEVSALDIHSAVLDMLKLGRNGFSALGAPRNEFLEGNKAFMDNFVPLFSSSEQKTVTPAIRVKGDGLQIAFIGNFKAEHSTENQIKWALEEGLGHDVEMLQENEVNLVAIRSAMEFSDLLFWVRTPGWLRVNDREMLELLQSAKIPTVSMHLDKFFSIPEREQLIGVHPFWRTKFVFTADGSRDEDFKARNVNHFWMKPAASAVYSHPGMPLDMYRCDVGFVGARGYHAEHPFRAELIDFLEKTYGDRFKLIDGLRGHGLNDFYQSCKVCVADCFGGGKIPRYWSDRMVETPMRHGFLLSPEIEGMTIPLATFDPENLTDLHEQIEYWLAHDDERKTLRSLCADHVAKHDTWTIRMAWILKTVQEGLSQASHA